MTSFLYLDIETIAAPSPEMVADITASITVPGSYKKPETIAEWEANTKPALIKEAIAKTALTGIAGQIVCIGWAWGDNEPDSYSVVGRPEHEALQYALHDIQNERPADAYRPIIVGHNVAGFDIRFLWQRAFVLGVTMPPWFPRSPAPWDERVHDTMHMWGGARDYVGLDAVCRAMGLPGKGNITGADVQGMWERGEHDAIAAYCRNDVARVREVHRKMLVSMGEAA